MKGAPRLTERGSPSLWQTLHKSYYWRSGYLHGLCTQDHHKEHPHLLQHLPPGGSPLRIEADFENTPHHRTVSGLKGVQDARMPANAEMFLMLEAILVSSAMIIRLLLGCSVTLGHSRKL